MLRRIDSSSSSDVDTCDVFSISSESVEPLAKSAMFTVCVLNVSTSNVRASNVRDMLVKRYLTNMSLVS